MRNYCVLVHFRVLYPSVSKSSLCFKVKNFTSNNNQSIAEKSNMYWNPCIQEEVSTRANPIGDWSKDSTIGWYFEIDQGDGKIFYPCNCLFLISGFLEVMTWKLPCGIFVLQEVFSIRQQITVFIKFPLHLVYLVIYWYLYDLHIIWPN